jgi:hypothetical protein
VLRVSAVSYNLCALCWLMTARETAVAREPKLLLEEREAAHAKSEKLKLTSRTSFVKYGF